jgi:predicted dehydrogenase
MISVTIQDRHFLFARSEGLKRLRDSPTGKAWGFVQLKRAKEKQCAKPRDAWYCGFGDYGDILAALLSALFEKAAFSRTFRSGPCALATPWVKVISKWIMAKQSRSEDALQPRLLNRRNFLKAAGSAAILPAVLPGYAAQSTGASANNRINLGVIGMGWQGPGNTQSFLASEDCQVVAACDIDATHLQAAIKMINDNYGTEDCKGYHDYKELLARDDIDAVMIAVPDHWHEIVATEAARSKKDIYAEKPLAHTIAEQQSIVRAVQQNGIIWQMGSWQRSVPTFHKAAEIVRNGLIGTVTHVEVGLPGGNSDFDGVQKDALAKLAAQGVTVTSMEEVVPGSKAWDLLVTDPPAELDYERWIGPSKMEPYMRVRSHKSWRWNYNTGAGQLLDWIGHHCDIAHWGLDFDNSGPSEVEGSGELPPANAVWNTAPKYRFELKYPQGVTMTIAGGYPDIKGGVKWIGTEGWVWVDRGGFEASNPAWKEGKYLPRELRKVKLYTSSNHQQNFLDCVRTREATITPVEVGHHSAIPGHLCLISMHTGKKIRWDVQEEKIIGDREASKLMTREYRAPWKMS